MADAAVTFLLTQLKDILIYSTKGDQFRELKNEVRELRVSLGEAASKMRAERSSDLERQMKEVVYDVEDTIESSSIKMAAAKASNIIFRAFLIKEIDDAQARAIQSIRSGKLDPIARTIRAYGRRPIAQRHSTETNLVPSEQQNKEDPAIGPKKIVGLEDEAETLIRSLMKETEEVDVIAITGMPGIGKTTLASRIYEDKRIRDEFPTRIWVDNIPLQFRGKDLCLNILKQGMVDYQEFDIPQESCSSKDSSPEILNEFSQINDDKLLNRAVRRYLKENRYLLVMDAVWDADSLSSIMDMLPEKGKVLITSFNNHITKKQQSHVVRFLNEKESWELLQFEVFGKLDECPDMLKPTGERIAKNCEGSPLAIVAAASSLVVESSTKAAEDLTHKWWEAVAENVTTYLTDWGQHLVITSVELSYTKLPQRQLYCFLYLGVFPQGHEIPVRTLARLWIAEGLVHDKGRLNLEEENEIAEEISEEAAEQILEETAEQILYDLINRNLVMIGRTYPNGQIKTCRLHKLIYEFCTYKAAEQNFYQEINKPTPVICRRLCIYSNLSEFLSSTQKGQRVRSIICLNKEEKHRKDSSAIHACFKWLRVLECRYITFTKFPNELTKLMHLRYISLSCDDPSCVVIPETISSLRYLETLVVETQSPSLEIKANIWRMLKLRHVVTKAAIILAIRKKGEGGKNLQTLTRLAPACCTEDVFTRAPNLKSLGIRGKLAALSSPESLRKLEHLQNLKLMNNPAAGSQLHRLIDPNCFPPNLKRLTLSGTYLGWECMSILGKIDGLEILKLKNNAFIGESWTSTDADDGFRRLGFLLIATTDLVSWEASSGSFPSLKCLVLKKCEKLEQIPLTLANSLDKLDVEVENLSESAAESARKIDQEIARRQAQNKR